MTASADRGADEQAVQSLLAGAWGIEAAHIALLGGELDASMRIDTADGSSFCLKGRREALADDGSVDLEVAALSHLAASDAELVPSLVPTLDGATTITSDGRVFWLLRWLDGRRWSDLVCPSPAQQRLLGRTARRLQTSLEGFEHAGAERTHHWDLRQLPTSIGLHVDQCADERQQQVAEQVLALLADRVSGNLADLPTSVVHQDLNDFNLIVQPNGAIGVIDFGDVLHSASITELAVTVAYAMLRSPHPIDAAANVIGGWYEGQPPSEVDLSVVFPLAFGRLLLNALTWSARHGEQPDYATARSSHTWVTLHALSELPVEFIDARLRAASGFSLADAVVPAAQIEAVDGLPPVVDLDPRRDVFDGIAVTDSDAVWAAATPPHSFALGHDQVRLDWGAPADGFGGPATIQLGVELHLGSEPTQVRLPVDGRVVEAGESRIVIEHDLDPPLWSCWSNLVAAVTADEDLVHGDPLGTAQPNAPATVQLLRYRPRSGQSVPHRVRPVDRSAWTSLSLDPAPFLGLPATAAVEHADEGAVTSLRNTRLASSQRYYYDEPMHLIRASGVTFVDSNAHHYLDVINNVTHVGHGNAHVVEQASRQMRRLNTNSRFVYEEMGRYADRLVERLPDPLEVVFLVCTGSEANDLAIRIARQVTGRSDVMVITGAYHGNTGVVTGISPNRYRGPGGEGPPPTTHEVLQPSLYRGPFGYDHPDPGAGYAADVRAVAERLVADGRSPAAFIAESLMGTAGQVVFPDGYLAQSFEHVRSVGGLCISDEVQVGFGRLGDNFWGFQRSGVVPDIVTMGKPMANGHPVAAVVTTRAIADAFDQGMKYFNTFGGNPVSCAAANAVLDEIDRLDLQQQSAQVGGYFETELRRVMEHEARIGDVRGVGLYLGVEFVTDPTTKDPDARLTALVCERLRERGIIMYPNGDLGNCLKIKPPMVFDRADVDRFVGTLQMVLAEV
jgi:4-aminobutyrate aminotransferase-like enzyme/Ser/Thr protein kinase RdoA (MazF antagonist)